MCGSFITFRVSTLFLSKQKHFEKKTSRHTMAGRLMPPERSHEKTRAKGQIIVTKRKMNITKQLARRSKNFSKSFRAFSGVQGDVIGYVVSSPFFSFFLYRTNHDTLTTAKNTTQSRFGYDQQLCFYPRGFESSCD